MSLVHFTSHASLDLDEIAFSIAQDDPAAAENFVDRLTQLCHVLAGYPYVGRERPELGPAIRSLPTDAYLLFYRPTPDGILVLRLLSGYQDIGPHLFRGVEA